MWPPGYALDDLRDRSVRFTAADLGANRSKSSAHDSWMLKEYKVEGKFKLIKHLE
jgi:hypothetical protein